MWDEIPHPFPNFNGATVEVWEWISDLIPHLYNGCSYLSMLESKFTHDSKWGPCIVNHKNTLWVLTPWILRRHDKLLADQRPRDIHIYSVLQQQWPVSSLNIDVVFKFSIKIIFICITLPKFIKVDFVIAVFCGRHQHNNMDLYKCGLFIPMTKTKRQIISPRYTWFSVIIAAAQILWSC